MGTSVTLLICLIFCTRIIRRKNPFARGRLGKGGVGRPEAEQARYGVKIPPRPSKNKARTRRPARPVRKLFFKQHRQCPVLSVCDTGFLTG